MSNQEFFKGFIWYVVALVSLIVISNFFVPRHTPVKDPSYSKFASGCVSQKLSELKVKVTDQPKFESFISVDTGRPFKQVGNFTYTGGDYFCEVAVYDEVDELICSPTCWTKLKK